MEVQETLSGLLTTPSLDAPILPTFGLKVIVHGCEVCVDSIAPSDTLPLVYAVIGRPTYPHEISPVWDN
jgi:hypothetical protein